MITLHQVPQGSDEWLKARVGKYSGSNSYKLLGPFGAIEYAKAIESSFKGNFYTKRGHILEDEALDDFYSVIFAAEVQRPGFITNSDYPDCLYSPDGIDGEILLEVKCFGEKPHMEIVNGHIPVKILAQIHFGMLIGCFKSARLIAYNPELEADVAFASIPVDYDAEIAANFNRILKGKTNV